MRVIRSLSATVFAIACAATSLTVHACPRINGLIDFNCDQELNIVGLGDSFVAGRGDLERPRNPGYLGRLLDVFPDAKVFKVGFPGFSSQGILQEVKEEFEKRPKGKIVRALSKADFLIIDAGRNDFFDDETPEFTVTTMRRLGLYVQAKTAQMFKYSPLAVHAFLAPSTRRFQEPFIEVVNALFLTLRSDTFPVYLRFDLLDPLNISIDGVHPFAAGHQQLADLAAEYLADEAQERAKALRSDLDKDGIYDLFERRRFKTSRLLTDMDSDGLKDGDEVFTVKSDPRRSDTDGDGVLDGTEVLQGSDPLSPLSNAPVLSTLPHGM